MMHKLMTALAVCVGVSIFPSMAAAQEVVEYYALDNVGSIRVVFGQNGAITSGRDYEPFGGEVTPVTSDPKVFAGLFRDDESKLDYAEARMHQSRTGRFISVDPVYAGLVDPQKWNRYSYALNSPLVWADVTGMNAQALRSPSVPACETFNCDLMLQMDLWWILGGGWGGSGGFAGDYGAEPRGSGGRASGTQMPLPETTAGTPPVRPPSTPSDPVEGPNLALEFAKGCGQGAAGFVDGVIPFGDPFEAAGTYSSSSPAAWWSQPIGGAVRDFAIAELTVGAVVSRAAQWLANAGRGGNQLAKTISSGIVTHDSALAIWVAAAKHRLCVLEISDQSGVHG